MRNIIHFPVFKFNGNICCREEADVDEFLISGDHDHYISSETIVLPNEAIAYEEPECEPKAKRRKTNHWESLND